MALTRRQLLKYGGLTATGVGVAAVAPWQIAWSAQEAAPDAVATALNRAAFGPRPDDVRHVRRIGLDAWLERQLAPTTIDDTALDARLATLPSVGMGIAELYEKYPQRGEPGPAQVVYELAVATMLRAIFSERQLLEVITDFWTNHLNIYILKGQCKWLKTVDDREVIRKHALGKFHDLLEASATSPAMLEYLDNRTNIKGVPNENYARELLELHSLGVNGGYTEEDVKEVARCFTGWTVRLRGEPGFVFDPRNHDNRAKVVLRQRIAAGGGIRDGQRVIDLVAAHSATAEHVAAKLVRRFVADDPPADLIRRVAQVFTRSKGDLRETLSAVLHAPEFHQSVGDKVKRPFEFLVSSLRGLEAASDAGRPLLDQLRRLGQPSFQWRTPDGYPDMAAAWINTAGMLSRWNVGLALAEGRVKGTAADLRTPTVTNDLTTAGEVVDFWTDRLLHRAIPGADRDQLVNYLSDGKPASFRLTERALTVKVPGLVALLLGSPHFQWR